MLERNLFEIDPFHIWTLEPSAVLMEGELIQGALPPEAVTDP